MAIRFSALLVIWLLTAPLNCFGQEADDFQDASLSREVWQKRIEDAQRRSQEFIANARQRSETQITSAQKDAEAASRALGDPSLQPGDVVSTGRGFVTFVGREEQHRPQDFLPAPSQQPPGRPH